MQQCIASWTASAALVAFSAVCAHMTPLKGVSAALIFGLIPAPASAETCLRGPQLGFSVTPAQAASWLSSSLPSSWRGPAAQCTYLSSLNSGMSCSLTFCRKSFTVSPFFTMAIRLCPCPSQ